MYIIDKQHVCSLLGNLWCESIGSAVFNNKLEGKVAVTGDFADGKGFNF